VDAVSGERLVLHIALQATVFLSVFSLAPRGSTPFASVSARFWTATTGSIMVENRRRPDRVPCIIDWFNFGGLYQIGC
jgi:hypothetical protein